ncbi:trehalase-like isoform X3 [Amphibalanus amphitrite]|uniref:trehalase-like isoform X3 n=1 Tax=Amphibalanus amphitrite TaxID=1232801 RepID=UPI001C901A58|nr:trehalase-like isoform X3 [Amphibalanus amphitrite]
MCESRSAVRTVLRRSISGLCGWRRRTAPAPAPAPAPSQVSPPVETITDPSRPGRPPESPDWDGARDLTTDDSAAHLLSSAAQRDIYCQGSLLHTVQMARLHKDSKHFVDMSMRYDPAEVKSNFDAMMRRTNQQPSQDDVRAFLNDNFEEPDSEFIQWHPSDWTENPKFLSRIADAGLRSWISELHGFWKQLGREVTGEVYLHPERYSLIFVPNPVVVPGGRFREFYYWDSYWVLKGLLLSEMHQTVRGMIENFLVMVERFGFVPNGGRVYFERRSQPPFLIPMVKLYLDATNDMDFLRTNMELLEREYQFWQANRTVDVQKDGRVYKMYRYNVEIGLPRPESYREDFDLAHDSFATENSRQMLYAQLKSGAESGWDFSTRWFIPSSDQQGSASLKDLKTRNFVPVDLNSLLYLNARLLSEFHTQLGNSAAAANYREQAETLRNNIQNVLWDQEAGSWFDYDTKNGRLNKKFYPSNIFPVWVNASTPQQNDKFLQYLEKVNVTNFLSGVPTSLENSGQQWDFPNAWPPLQHVLVESLNQMGSEEAKQLAYELVQKWIDTNYLSYMEAKPHAMFEKYDVTRMGLPGGGGEYDVQLGFGWSNGVAMTFADQYGDRLRAPSAAARAPPLWTMAVLLPVAALAAVSALLCWRCTRVEALKRHWAGPM